MIRVVITAADLERARTAYAAAWLATDQQRAKLEPGDRTRAGLKAALLELGIVVES